MSLLAGGPRPIRGPFTRWPRSADAVLAAAVLLITLVNGEFENPEAAEGFTLRFLSDLPVGAYILAATGTGALYWRRRLPMSVLAATMAGSLVWVGLDYSSDPLIAVPFALYGVGRYVERDKWSYLSFGTVLLAVGIADLFDGGLIATIPLDLLFIFLPWYLGRRLRVRGEYVGILKERAEYLEREQAAEAGRAVADERSRIARELHDVVAHRVSLMTVQAGAAKTVASDDPDKAHEAMEAVEQAGRQALGELRHLLGVLRPDADGGQLGPQPGIADIPQLVEQVRDAGLVVQLAMDGLPREIPSRVGLSVYRIAQEALTNVIKHAGPDARARVLLSGGQRDIVLEVTDTGSSSTVLPGSGHGIAGMRERAMLLGGHLEAGPTPNGGFQVVARLPHTEAAP